MYTLDPGIYPFIQYYYIIIGTYPFL